MVSTTKVSLLLLSLVVLSVAVSAQEGDMAPAPAPGMASSTNSSLPVLGGILITSLMSFLALLSH